MLKIKYDYNEEQRSIILPEDVPFDGGAYLIKFAEGWMEARWVPHTPNNHYFETEGDGFLWCCLDDRFQKQLDDALGWLPLPDSKEKYTLYQLDKEHLIKDIATEFFYSWHNSGGITTVQGFDDWWKLNKVRFDF